jgi:hypothetical protein
MQRLENEVVVTNDQLSGKPNEAAAGDATLPPRQLTPEAQRALAEAEERRRARDAAEAASPKPKEFGGRAGLDPVRHGDWENGGIASDF